MGGGVAHPTTMRSSPLKRFVHVWGHRMMFSGFVGLS
jgi:hypothetical protein